MAPSDAVTLIRTGKSVLDGWHNTYMQVREKIEVSGRDARWEFSKPMLFERTNYMSEICSDLNEMIEIVDDFHKFLGPELKAVTGDSQVAQYQLLHGQASLSSLCMRLEPVTHVNQDALIRLTATAAAFCVQGCWSILA